MLGVMVSKMSMLIGKSQSFSLNTYNKSWFI